MEKMIDDTIKGQIEELFADLTGSVEIMFFTKAEDCEYCDEIEQLIGEVAELSDLIAVTVYPLDQHPELAAQYHVKYAPTLVMLAREGDDLIDYGIRLLGAPAGHEFTTLIHDILFLSRRSTDLSDDARSFLNGLTSPLLLQVFVTPTCPYCPQAVLLAHQMAMESEMVQAEMVEATEYSDLANQFMVSGVPQTTINSGAGRVVGALPEQALIAQIEAVLAG